MDYDGHGCSLRALLSAAIDFAGMLFALAGTMALIVLGAVMAGTL